MKKSFLFALFAAIALTFAACDPEDDNRGNNGNNDDNNYATLIVGTWQVDNMTVDGENMTPQNMRLSFDANGRGLMNDNGETQNNDFGWSISGNIITITPHHGQFSFTITSLTSTECAFNGTSMEMDGHEITGDIRFHMTKVNGGGDDPNPPDPAYFPAGTQWVCAMDSTFTETDDDGTYTYVIDAEMQLNFDNTGNTGTLGVVGTMSITYNGIPVYSDQLDESDPFTWTYDAASYSGTLTNSGVDDDGQPYQETIPFTYNPANATIIMQMIDEDDEGNPISETYVFHRTN